VNASVLVHSSGTPVPTPWGDVYEALGRGIVVGATNYIMTVGPVRHNEVSDYFNYVGLGQAVQGEIINKDVWNALPDDIRQIMREVMAEAHIHYVEATAKIAVDEVERLSNAPGAERLIFHHMPDEERQRWIDQSPDFFAQWAEENAARGRTKEIVEAFFELQAKYVEEGEKLGYVQMWRGPSPGRPEPPSERETVPWTVPHLRWPRAASCCCCWRSGFRSPSLSCSSGSPVS
jgi:TRAP-type mannitol/chloroaromatic compound transport system substrate-binding protein